LSTGRKRKKQDNRQEVLGFLGVGLDNQDGHRRVTQGEHFLLVGGSEETHERMQDTALKFDEALKRRGKTLKETSAEEALDLLHDALEP
jgi:hypothetical protein